MNWMTHLRYRLRGVRLRLRFFFRGGEAEAEMDEELRFHLEEEIRRNVGGGMDPREARRQAYLAFGGVERVREEVRNARGVRPVENLIQDTRLAFRKLRQDPLFTAVAVLTLAMGVGANTGTFSVVNGLLLRDRPYQDPDRLVHVYSAVEGESPYATSYALDLPDLRSLDDVFLDVGAFRGAAARVSEDDGARMVLVEAVTWNLFPLLGIETTLGRGFSPEEEGGLRESPLVILGHGFWQERYGGDRGVLGTTLRVAGRPCTVIGVAPPTFESFTAQGFKADLLIPFSMAGGLDGSLREERDRSERGPLGAKIIARLRPGTSVEQAQARVDGLTLALKAAHPTLYRDRSFHLYPTRDVAIQPDLDAYLMSGATLLLATMGLVLLLACTNLAGFLLARGVDRKREMALRLALGAPRARLIRQLLTETLVLGLLGTGVGLLLARLTLDLLVTFRPPMALPLNVDTRMDWSVLAFTVLVAGLAGLLAGLAPALQASKADAAPLLKTGPGSGGRRTLSLRSALVAFQMAFSVVLLVVGGLFTRSFQAARHTDPGFDTGPGALIWVDLAISGLPREEWEGMREELVSRARDLPGVEAASAANGAPLSEAVWQAEFTLPGVPLPDGEEYHRIHYLAVDPAFLEVMGLPLIQGRGITPQDRAGTEAVALVSRTAAERFWPGQDPLGREIRPREGETTFTVAGVVQDTKVGSLREDPTPLLYFSGSQFRGRTGQLWLVARGTGDPRETVKALRRMVREADPELVIVQAKTMEEHLALSLFLPRVGALLLGSFGLLALALSAVGLYGVVSYSASRRTQEVGIRISLGAEKGAVVRMVVREGMGVVVVGGLVGFGASLLLVRLLAQYLIGIGPYDLITFAGVPVVLVAVSVLATYLPARRASRVSPMLALKNE